MPAPTGGNDRRLPVTLLSGFLGSGKTTLLSNILKSKDHGLRCALIVNDMGALNIDASLIKNHKLTQQGEKMIQMQNGCICCTLRADLLEEIANLAEMDAFDYLLIESSGISEPIQVAETFTQEFAESIGEATPEEIAADLPKDDGSTDASRLRLAHLIANGGLSKIARLDTCVSVVDCTTFHDDFDTTDFLTDRLGKDVDPEDERNITDLLIDQIEFANVILLNKVDAVSKAQVERAEKIVKTLNPDARIFRTSYSKLDLKELLNTNLFDFSKAASSAGWLQSMRENSDNMDADGNVRKGPKPETEEYGVSSFVYTARRPFHPKRLWDLMSKPFCVLQNSVEEDDDEDEDDEDGGDDEEEDAIMEESKEEILARLQKEKAELDLPARAAAKRESPVFKGLLRSKGFCWLATRPHLHGEWSQAGVMFTLEGGGPWMCCVDESEWPTDDPELIEAIKKDFEGTWGDRRQELVFIGQELDRELLTKTLDAVILDDKEWTQWQKIMNLRRDEDYKMDRLVNVFDDGWEAWASYMADEEDEEQDMEADEDQPSPKKSKKKDAHGHSHPGHKHHSA